MNRGAIFVLCLGHGRCVAGEATHAVPLGAGGLGAVFLPIPHPARWRLGIGRWTADRPAIAAGAGVNYSGGQIGFTSACRYELHGGGGE
jgi:hypothetical protein